MALEKQLIFRECECLCTTLCVCLCVCLCLCVCTYVCVLVVSYLTEYWKIAFFLVRLGKLVEYNQEMTL